MPHRATYFFPRQFPDRGGFDASSTKFLLDHEKKIGADQNGGKSSKEDSEVAFKQLTKLQDEDSEVLPYSNVSDRITGGDKIHGKQLAAFVNWLAEKKKKEKPPHQNHHVKIKVGEEGGEEEEGDEYSLLLLPTPPEAVPKVVDSDHSPEEQKPSVRPKNQNASLQRLSSTGSNYSGVSRKEKGSGFERQVPLQRLPSTGSNHSSVLGKEKGLGVERQVSLQRLSSAGSTSYAGSLFSGITLDGNWPSTGVKDSNTSTTTEAEVEDAAKQSSPAERDELVPRLKEGYYLQLTLAKRIVEQATLAGDEPLLLQECRSVKGLAGSSDPETVSFRLWVSTDYSLQRASL